uniref:RING-type E3 ubiquitin transferase n=1 Tax=Anas zonorhyncha TaxID=75864 RepID=A0A8B9UYM7_9AVES
MRDEARRLRTFSQWPDSSPVPALDLAEAGFYFVGPGDHVQCFCCGGILKDWKAGDCPMVEHLKFFPFYLLRNWRSLSLPSVDQFSVAHNVLEMGFDPLRVLSLVDNKYVLTGTHYLSESELISDLLQLDWEENSVEETPLSTEEQLRRLQEERTCKVCMDRDVSVVFVPCGHLVACGECALNLRLCPICRAVIRESVRTFMS